MPVKDYATLRLEAPQTSPIGNPAVAVHEVRKLAAGPHPASQQYQQQQLYQQQQYQLQQQQQQQHPQYLGLGRPVPQSPCESPPGGSQCSPQLTQLQSCARQVRQAGQVCTPRRLGKVAQRAAQLRSPVVKRPVGAPVAQQGWLHKQGSDGLMLWKKRWFVLCDYCLFYYKGPEEEKLLGSILLPSYTISPCSPQVDKVYRKFSFKAEHVNMRTYYFASDTHEGMLQWMHCMSLASVLQDRPSYEEPRVINQQPTNSQHSPGDESDAGFGTYRPRLAVSSGSMNGWQSPLLQQPQQQPQQQQQQQQQQNAFDDRNYHHHLYANAPPKPRRLANEDMGSSSDQSPEHHQSLSQSMSQSISQSMNAQPQQPPRLMQTNYQYNPGAVPQVQSRLVMSPNNAERRTPDTYSRPAGTVQPNVAGKIKLGDYEDVYNSERNQLWTNKFGQAAYLQTSGSSATIITKGYEATYNNHVEAAKQQPQQPQQLQQPQQQQLQQQQLSSLLGQTPRAKQPPRPHSADFLEYDARRHEEVIDMAKNQEPQVRGSRSQFNLQPPRPKSSLDIMRDPDNLYWSEEGYAQKMRQSAYVLQQTPGGALPNPQVPTRNNFPSFSNMLQSQSSSRVSELAANRVLSPSAELMRESEQQHILNMQRRQQQLLEEQKILQQELEYQKQQSHQEQLQRQQIEEEEERQLLSYYSEMQAPMSQQPFMRSASARLPRHRYDPERDDDDEAYKPRRNSGSGAGLYAHRRPGSEYGSQKFQQYTAVSTTPDMSTSSSLEATAPREESMKRLLEWKQRMLQSPLARKPSGSATRGVNSAQNQLSNYYKQQALRELADQERRAQGLEISRHLSQDALVDVPYLNNSKLMEMQDLVDDQAGSVPWSTEMLDSQETADFLALKSQEDAGKMSRSRSQDGRRSSASNRYTSYSSDEDMSLSLSGAGSSRDFALAQSQVQVQVQGPQAPRDSTATRALSSLSARINSLDREITALSRSQTMELSTPESLASPDSSTSPPSPGDFLELIRPRTWESLEVQEARAKEALEFREAYQAHKVSAGELLGRTHEELVLLLIQLRRSSAAVCKAMESCHMEIETQARLAELDTPKQMEHLQRLDDLKKQLVELEKQHEKGKPLVNLVDNMVKLGSLYQSGSPTSGLLGSSSMQSLGGIPVRERLEFNYKVQEQRLLAEERRDWDRLSPDYGQLQAKVQQLYRLDQEMQEESHTLQTLQVDKELVERALTGVRLKLATAQIPPNLRDTYRKQQRLLERELSRIRLLLAHNSKKLEETVAENARLEQELVILRQKLQTSRQESFSSPPLGMVDADYPLTPDENPNSTAHLEAELKRVQLIMGDLHRQRQEISVAVKQLTEKADPVRPGPTGVAGAGPIPGKKKQQSSWVETDLDSLVSRETGNNSQPTSPVSISVSVSSNGSTPLSSSTVPLYVNTGLEKPQADTGGETQTLLASNDSSTTSLSQIELSEADDRMKRFYGIIPKEKQQEFKTVRIVKRESERRQRDRDRSGNIGIPLFTSTGKRVALLEDQSDNTEQRTQQSILGQLLESEEACAPLPSHMDIFPSSISNPTTSASLLNNEPTLLSVSNAMTTSLTNTSSMSIATTSSSSSNYMSSSWAQEGANDSSQALDEAMAQLDDELEMSAEAVFQRSHSLPRGFGKTNAQGMEVEAAPSMDNKYNFRMKKPLVASAPGSESNLSMAGMRRQRVRFDTHSGSGSESNTSSPSGSRPLSAREQLFGSAADDHLMTGYSMLGLASRETSPQLSPVFSNHAAYQSEAARQIVMEMNACSPSVLPPQRVAQQKVLKQRQAQPQQQPQDSQQSQSTQRRLVPREKRRHHTVSGRPLSEISSSPLPVLGTRSRDDLDMERALRTRHNVAPDVVRSTLSRRAPKFDADTIDSILGTPGKIHIPERYVPENEPALSQEERLQRLRKADAIRKMLSETRSGTSLPSASGEEEPPTSTLKKKAEEEKKQHEHLLQLNQLLAKQVMEKSKIVAEKALSQCPPEDEDKSTSDDESPEHPLPLYQQRENFYS